MSERIKLPGVSGTWYGDEVEARIVQTIDDEQGEFAKRVAQKAKTDAGEHGDLAKGIRARRKKGSRPNKRTGWIVLSTSPLSALFEYGTKQRTRASGGATGRMRKYGLIWPAVDAFKRDLVNRLGGSL